MNSWFLAALIVTAGVFIPSTESACSGPKGPVGPDGAAGSKGTGTNDNWYVVTQSRNWRQCAWNYADGRDSGVIYTCQFTKEHANTALYVQYNAVMRICCCHGCCTRWYFTFDGSECSAPNKIEGVVYMANYYNADLHRYRKVQGYCTNLGAGTINVAVNVGTCSGYGYYDAYSGWNSVSRIIIEEVPPSPYGD
ncbi:collagen triple helix repeat-containing protein 1-like [Ptychodera flava]|uniref:collagen triple helix repeat-containing protein 1-like n=1 Tax=Ptychodera flava TaxID=63121 RepID=UPI00396A8189